MEISLKRNKSLIWPTDSDLSWKNLRKCIYIVSEIVKYHRATKKVYCTGVETWHCIDSINNCHAKIAIFFFAQRMLVIVLSGSGFYKGPMILRLRRHVSLRKPPRGHPPEPVGGYSVPLQWISSIDYYIFLENKCVRFRQTMTLSKYTYSTLW